MYSVHDRCIQCGTRARPENLTYDSDVTYSLAPDGEFSESSLWFCSVDCYRKAIDKFVDPQFLQDFFDRPEVIKQMKIWLDKYCRLSIFNPRRFKSEVQQGSIDGMAE